MPTFVQLKVYGGCVIVPSKVLLAKNSTFLIDPSLSVALTLMAMVAGAINVLARPAP